MDGKLLNSKNKLSTPGSGTTVYIDYSPSKKVLEVEFAGGNIYHYFPVEPRIWEEYREIVESGGSSGVYVNTKIKPRYEYLQIR